YSQSSLEKWKLLGLINNELESYSEAEYCFNEALSINPNDVDALSSLYQTYIFKSEYNKALEISEKLIAIKPDKVRFLRGKAEALYYLGNLKECQKIYQNIYSTKDNSLDIRNRIDEIKEMRNISKKNWYVTLILAIILPSFHRFYAGKWGTGILYIIIMIASLNFCKPICWALYFVDILFILSGFFKDKEGKYITIF
ncbi:TM2 domain-containing protein, partial [Brachyspira aalborgi]